MRATRLGLRWAAAFAAGVFIGTMSGCASLSHHKDEQEVSRIKKAALVGFTVDEPAGARLGLDLGSGRLGAGQGGSLITRRSANVDRMFAELRDAFAKKMSWEMTETGQMTAQPGYLSAYKDTMEGWHNKFPVGHGKNRYAVPRVMDSECMRILGEDGRDRLMTALGVDALITARIDVHFDGTTVMGIGNRHPQSDLSFMVYERGKETPVWFEGRIQGDTSSQSAGATVYTDDQSTDRLALESARTAFSRIDAAVE